MLTLALGLTFLLTQMLEYSRLGFAPRDGAFATDLLRADGPARRARRSSGSCCSRVATVRAFRGHFSPEHHHGVEIPGIYWHFVDVMWIVVYATVYIL